MSDEPTCEYCGEGGELTERRGEMVCGDCRTINDLAESEFETEYSLAATVIRQKAALAAAEQRVGEQSELLTEAENTIEDWLHQIDGDSKAHKSLQAMATKIRATLTGKDE